MEIDQKDSYSANSVWINGTVLVPKGFESTVDLIKNKGYNAALLIINITFSANSVSMVRIVGRVTKNNQAEEINIVDTQSINGP